MAGIRAIHCFLLVNYCSKYTDFPDCLIHSGTRFSVFPTPDIASLCMIAALDRLSNMAKGIHLPVVIHLRIWWEMHISSHDIHKMITWAHVLPHPDDAVSLNPEYAHYLA